MAKQVARRDPLMDLADRINDAHRQCEESLRSGLAHAREAGELLSQAKKTLPHGEWLPWLRKHCSCSVRMAQNYMRIAAGWPELEAKAQRVAYLPVRDALQLLVDDRGCQTDTAAELEARISEMGRGKAARLIRTLRDGAGHPLKIGSLSTAAETGYMTNGRFLVRMSPQEWEVVSLVADCCEGRALSAEKVATLLQPPADCHAAEVIPGKDSLRVLDRKQWEYITVPASVFCDTMDGRRYAARAADFEEIQRRHPNARLTIGGGEVATEPGWQILRAWDNEEVVAALIVEIEKPPIDEDDHEDDHEDEVQAQLPVGKDDRVSEGQALEESAMGRAKLAIRDLTADQWAELVQWREAGCPLG